MSVRAATIRPELAKIPSFLKVYRNLRKSEKQENTLDPRRNPFTPNAGARPPALVGRDDELTAFDILLYRLQAGHAERSMLITGLRGVGKTVLLGAFEERARLAGWATVETEITRDSDFRGRMAQLVRRALLQVAPRERWRERARRAAGVLRSFAITVSSEGADHGLPRHRGGTRRRRQR